MEALKSMIFAGWSPAGPRLRIYFPVDFVQDSPVKPAQAPHRAPYILFKPDFL
jgi:hypothetical protein